MESWEAGSVLEFLGLPRSAGALRQAFASGRHLPLSEVLADWSTAFRLAWSIPWLSPASLGLALAGPRGVANLTLGFRARRVGSNSDPDTQALCDLRKYFEIFLSFPILRCKMRLFVLSL